MKKLFFLFLALIATTSLLAEDFSVDGIYYNYLDGNNVEVTYRGDFADSYEEYSGAVTIPASVTYNGTIYSVTSIGNEAFAGCSSLSSVTIPNSVTSIGDLAFFFCSSLTSVTIPNSVTSIGDDAFYECRSLTSVSIPNSVTSIGDRVFDNCSSLTSVTIPNSVTSIGDRVFDNCSSLTSVTIPNSVTSIGDGAFYYCRSLTSVTIPNSVTSIGDYAFSGCSFLTSPVYNAHCFAYLPPSFEGAYTIPYGIKQIAGGAFYFCSSLTSITIPNSVTSIGDGAFYYCRSLTSITIPNSVTSIGDEAFYECSSLTSPVYNAHCFAYMPPSFEGAYTIPYGIKQIAGYAFYNCSSLTSITIPNSVTSIGDGAFYDCSSLTSVTIPNSVTSIGSYAFSGCRFAKDNFVNNSTLDAEANNYWGAELVDTEIDGLLIRNDTVIDCRKFVTSVSIPNSVTSIGDRAFQDCSSLTSIIIPNSVTSIGERAFYECSSLTSITIPNSVTSIGNSAFYYCRSLTSVTIPNSVTSIGVQAFYYCTSLTSITCEAETPPTVGQYAFYRVSKSIPVYVPCGRVDAYKAAEDWKDFTNIQEPLAEYSIKVSVNETIMGIAKVDYNTFCKGAQISALAYDRYHFVQWSDGNTDNPRNLILTQDTVLTAEFALTIAGQCGDNLYWDYDKTNQTISITGSGDMYDYTAETQPWLLFKEDIKEVTVANTATSIGTSAFEGCIRLSKISLGTGLKNIAANAFAGCTRLYDIYLYATYPPFADQSSFANYNVYLHVPCDYKEGYDLDIVWGNFKYIECMGAESEPINPDTVIVIPGTNDVTITWPTEENAYHYIIEIKKDGVVFCTLTFNADGQLLNIAFAPSRDGNNRPALYAEQVINGGLRFTVTGLEEGTNYSYDVITTDQQNQEISTHSGEFTTKGGTTTDLSNHSTPQKEAGLNTQKLLRDGQLLILRDGKTYNVMGAEIQ